MDTSNYEYLRDCEARDYVSKAKINGLAWWKQYKERLIKQRGQKAVDELIKRMEKVRANARKTKTS